MAAAARSFLRSTSVRTAAARLSKPKSNPFRFPTSKPTSHCIFRSPVEMSVCVDTMLPFHTVTASALMTSLLTVSRSGYAWLPEGVDDTS